MNNNKIIQRYPSTSAAKLRHFPTLSLPLIYDRHRPWWNQILDPGSEFVDQWNHIFLVTCLVALFLDPLYFFLPVIGGRVCMTIDFGLAVVITLIRSVVDLFSVLHMAMKFRTAYVAPSSRVFGKGELVTDPKMIAIRADAYSKRMNCPGMYAFMGIVDVSMQVLGASWYLLSIERQYSCWRLECRKEQNFTHSPSCNPLFLDCWNVNMPERHSYGQSLNTSTYVGETLFSSLICLAGLVLFAQLIGNMQTYLQSSTARLEEWRVKRRDTEEWMRHRQLPPDLQNRVRRFVQYKWLATRGVDEEEILRALPLDIRRQIQRHLCLALVRRVPFFSQMDDQLLDAICERLVSSLSTKDTYIVREGDPVNEMLFIIRGQLESSTTNGGRSGFFNSITLKQGDFCGEELLTWALMPSSSLYFPSSTRTVRALTEVEAFALRAEDLKFVANQFKRLHSKKLQHAFRYYSHQWRTWGACYIQTAWRRLKRKKLVEELSRQESGYGYVGGMDPDGDFEDDGGGGGSPSVDSNGQFLGATFLASKFAANTRKGVAAQKGTSVVETGKSGLEMPKLFKPDEPDFSAD
ncbi:hypothetical protein C3L33_00725, partial [Rhododendron williamsianum]